MPFAGFALESVVPFTVTRFGIKYVPLGIASVNTIFYAMVFPLFVNVVVYVMLSFRFA